MPSQFSLFSRRFSVCLFGLTILSQGCLHSGQAEPVHFSPWVQQQADYELSYQPTPSTQARLARASHRKVNRVSTAPRSTTPQTKSPKQQVAIASRQSKIDRTQQQIDHSVATASRRYGVSSSLIRALIRQESNFNPRAVSRTGARGLTQLMPSTAWGECQLAEHELFEIDKNINCGVSYLSKQLKTFGRVDLALAAYNAGPGAVSRAIAAAGSREINQVTPHLKAETAPYVRKIVANK